MPPFTATASGTRITLRIQPRVARTEITGGHTGRSKTVSVSGLTPDDVAARPGGR